MAYAKIDDLKARAGDRFLAPADEVAANAFLEDASAIIDSMFARHRKDVDDADPRILRAVVCNMALRAMDSYMRSEQQNESLFDGNPFASQGYFNYRGAMEPLKTELASLGLPQKRTSIGTAEMAFLDRDCQW